VYIVNNCAGNVRRPILDFLHSCLQQCNLNIFLFTTSSETASGDEHDVGARPTANFSNCFTKKQY
jgi:hypothetical protein